MNGTIRYSIRPYDTIWMLAQVFNTTVDSILGLNPGIDPRNLQIGQVITIQPGYQYYPDTPRTPGMPGAMPGRPGTMPSEDEVISRVEADLTDYMRMLWNQHVAWTRMAVMGIVHDLPETDMMIQRLLRNPQDFANVLASFYGEEEAQRFEELFSQHITIAADLVRAAKAGDTAAVQEAEQRWYENADEIASYLASLNPNWHEEDWSAMMNEHLDLLGENVTNMVAGNYEESINGYDDVEAQALEMADIMAEGLYEQFPG
ncbi:LysM peptidoglycan-binding domain-containing protein [Mobilitalea sibirica]|uniref:LysM peptidoglycan-binding domain-containing protein n=1 Tax=Mobilitalea sibirica TaxID=1462919 RepID=A0A8J7H157_9FIRM|nr:LysM domain-containing protein [Mobilitalea sibirica]MBH1940049.1 LysM peptidoglycan-binding domain-containing protein [Mobilitalea sibirica]